MKARFISIICAVALSFLMAVPAVAATTYYGPSLTVSSTTVTAGQTENIMISTTSASTFDYPPAGGSNGEVTCAGNGTSCTFTLQACTTFGYTSIHTVSVTDPNDNVYYLGGVTTYGLSWPVAFGGLPADNTAHGLGPAINVSQTDSFTIPFGEGVGGFTLNTSLTNPPNNLNPEGPYYWYAEHANSPISSSLNPTSAAGVYKIEIEGVVVCGNSVTPFSVSPVFFDSSYRFTATTTSTPNFPPPVPEFPSGALGMGALMAACLAALLVMKKRSLK